MLDATRLDRDVKRARSFLATTTYTMPFIARETGLSYWWLTRFARGEIMDPKVSKLGAMLRFIEKTK